MMGQQRKKRQYAQKNWEPKSEKNTMCEKAKIG